MPGPVQHITQFVAVNDGSGNFTAETAGLNTDRPAGYPNAWPGGVTDPSTNNEVDGAGLIRNQFVDGTLKNRTLRDGGSGRPQYRIPGEATCTQRTYTIQAEDNFSFKLDSDDSPQNFAAIMEIAGIAFTADPSIWNTGSGLPAQADINALAAMDTGWVAAGATCTGTSDADCPACITPAITTSGGSSVLLTFNEAVTATGQILIHPKDAPTNSVTSHTQPASKTIVIHFSGTAGVGTSKSLIITDGVNGVQSVGGGLNMCGATIHIDPA